MKKIVEILNYIDFMDYMSKIKRYSYEVTKKGLIISTADLNIKDRGRCRKWMIDILKRPFS